MVRWLYLTGKYHNDRSRGSDLVVGPITGATLVRSSVIALSIGIGVVKSIAVMVITPLVSKIIKIDKPREAIIFGGLLGTTSGTSAAMAAIDPASYLLRQ